MWTHLDGSQGLASPFTVQLRLSDVPPTGSFPQTLPEIVGAEKGEDKLRLSSYDMQERPLTVGGALG